MTSPLEEIQALLAEGMRQSGQTSLGRRQPSSAAIPHLSNARARLRAFVGEHPEDARAWRMLSLAEEAMLAYPKAIAALQRAIEIEGAHPDKRDLKRLAALGVAAGQWAELPLTPEQLVELGRYLESKLADGIGIRDDLDWTRQWLRDHAFEEADVRKILEALAKRGGNTDEGVLVNVVQGAVV